MTSSRPYLLRGLFEWILDNHLTPYVLINALDPEVSVPQDFISDGRIILNVTPGIVSDLEMTNEFIRFQARFGGIPHHIYAPISAVMAVYAKENGRGMVFPEDPEDTDKVSSKKGVSSVQSSTPSSDDHLEPLSPPPKKGRPNLKVIK